MKKATIDIGGTNTRFAIFEDNKIVFKEKFLTNKNNYKETLDKLIELINFHNIENLALCIPGPANYKDGIVYETPNLPSWTNLDVKNYLLSRAKINKIIFQNDANAMAYAAHKKYNDAENGYTQFFTISTGFGAGLVIEDKIINGFNFQAQEIAKMPTGNKLDNYYHLSPYAAELYVSGTGFELQAKSQGLQKRAKEVLDDYHLGINYAVKIVENAIEALAKTMACSCALINPNLIVIGGTVAQNAPFIIQKAFVKLKEYVWKTQYDNLKLVIDDSGDDLALMGLDLLLENYL